MLRSAKEITGRVTGYQLSATDGRIGHCKDLLFDDSHWAVRYAVVDTGGWLRGRKVVVSPIAFGEPSYVDKTIPVRATMDQIESAPPLDEKAPLSRRYEIEFSKYFSMMPYWAGAGPWGVSTYPAPLLRPDRAAVEALSVEVEGSDSDLRSVREITGYHVYSGEEQVGEVDDFIIDDHAWIIRYLVVDTGRWLPGKKILIAPDWVLSMAWADRRVLVDVTKQAIEKAPAYDPAQPVNRVLETQLYDYLGRPYYWG